MLRVNLYKTIRRNVFIGWVIGDLLTLYANGFNLVAFGTSILVLLAMLLILRFFKKTLTGL